MQNYHTGMQLFLSPKQKEKEIINLFFILSKQGQDTDLYGELTTFLEQSDTCQRLKIEADHQLKM